MGTLKMVTVLSDCLFEKEKYFFCFN